MPDDTAITPWPAPPDAPTLLFGGSFDPPHLGHVELAVAARDAALPDGAWVVWVPAARSPHKESTGASAEDRLTMLRLATEGVARGAIWTDELDRAGRGEPSYWVDTLERARAARGGGAALRFLIGADQAVAFHRWREARRILSLAEPLVIPRGAVADAPALLEALGATGAWEAPDLERWEGWFVATGMLDASSTGARAGESRALHPSVRAHIEARGLYR